MPRILLTLLLLCSPAATQAGPEQPPMTGAEFDAYTQGNTLTYMEGGQSYGVEQYLSNHQVTWSFKNDDCKKGYWYEPEPTMICFVYEDTPGGPQCWNFFKTDSGIRARFISDPMGLELYEAQISRAPLICLGPRVGA